MRMKYNTRLYEVQLVEYNPIILMIYQNEKLIIQFIHNVYNSMIWSIKCMKHFNHLFSQLYLH